jgi:serine/threonine-protein kinase HipA
LMGATDGHAKNFSIRLYSGGKFETTPIYDVLSSQPIFDKGGINRNQFKLSMAAGKHRHYRIDTITGRHFKETVEQTGLTGPLFNIRIAKMIETAEQSMERAANSLPSDFPATIRSSIEKGIRKRLVGLASINTARIWA